MGSAIVTGAAGFAGCNLVEALLRHGYRVYAVVRHGSGHNGRLHESDRLHLVYSDIAEYGELHEKIGHQCDMFFHLAWTGDREDFSAQHSNVGYVLQAVGAAARMGCRRFICTGSQAEYGTQMHLTDESAFPDPSTAYGAAKVAACYLSRQRAKELGIDWIWGRIFSLYGKYEPRGRMLPDLVASLRQGQEFRMTSATQSWDFLYAEDGAEALIAMAERGKPGEIYNIANGDWRPLRDFTEEARGLVAPGMSIHYGGDPRSPVSLRPSVEKICRDTGWKAETSFADGMRKAGWI